jgi:hypothetical protein
VNEFRCGDVLKQIVVSISNEASEVVSEAVDLVLPNQAERLPPTSQVVYVKLKPLF